eukprot:7462754-Ditylum_brightwellii.AAC.3
MAEPEKKHMQNANDVLKNRQKKAASESHFDSCLNWDIKKFIFEAVVEKHTVSGAKLFPCDRKKKYHLTRAWNEIIAVCNLEEKECLTLQRSAPLPDSSDYKEFCLRIEQFAASIETRVFQKNMILYKEAYGKVRSRQTCGVAALTYLLDDIAKRRKVKK